MLGKVLTICYLQSCTNCLQIIKEVTDKHKQNGAICMHGIDITGLDFLLESVLLFH